MAFLSLDASRLAAVLAARWVARPPYAWSPMRVTRDADTLTCRTRRRWPGPRGLSTTFTVRPASG